MKCNHKREKYDIDACHKCFREPKSEEFSECPKCLGEKKVTADCGICTKVCTYCDGKGVKKWSYNNRLFFDNIDKICDELSEQIERSIFSITECNKNE